MKTPNTWELTGNGSVCLFFTLFLSAWSAVGQTPIVAPSQHQAPPPSPPSEVRSPVQGLAAPKAATGPTLYSIGQPTDEEQLYLEFINRSRANPAAEGVRLATTTDPSVLAAYTSFGVDLGLLQSQFNAISNAPPLAMNAKLIAAARMHSGDMFTNQYQDHTGTDGSNPGTRITAQGYSWNTYGENIFAYAKSPFYGHAGFNVDWGTGTGGMQTPAGHRVNIHNPAYREIGVGVVDGVNGSVGPQLVTQDFGSQFSSTPFITGVVYYDVKGQQFYDVGEGIGGITVNVGGVNYYSVTADSGGYAIPVPGNGTYAVTFSGPGLAATQSVTVVSNKNVKLDLVPAYAPPVISGPNPAAINQTNTYSFTSVAGATAYQWQSARLTNYTVVEGAENGTGGVTSSNASTYPVLVSGVAASGTHSFHLAHPTPIQQSLTLNAMLRVQATSQLTFDKELGYSGSGEIARAQVSTDGGATWKDVWNQTGSNGPGESSFSHVSASLAAYAGNIIQIRLVYDFVGGTYYSQTGVSFGFYIDNIAVTQAQQVLNTTVSTVPSGTSFALTPATADTFLLNVRPIIRSRTMGWGPSLVVNAASVPAIQLAGTPVAAGGQIKIDFTVTSYRTNMTFQLWKASDPAGPWALDSSASLTTLVSGSKFRQSTTLGTASKTYYRVVGF